MPWIRSEIITPRMPNFTVQNCLIGEDDDAEDNGKHRADCAIGGEAEDQCKRLHSRERPRALTR